VHIGKTQTSSRGNVIDFFRYVVFLCFIDFLYLFLSYLIAYALITAVTASCEAVVVTKKVKKRISIDRNNKAVFFRQEMGDSILLASQSTLFTISLRNNDCSLFLSRERKSLMIEEAHERSISGVEMNLTRDSDIEILSSLLIPIRSPSSL
ncbi:hypothetical protein PFISCL1PPCAC_28528, partial [Pristionchus fissidentatus]